MPKKPSLLLLAVSLLSMQALAAPQPAEMAGYLLVSIDKVPETYNAGFSMYVAAWPILKTYPGHRFQTGLFGTWMFAQYDGPKPEKMYSDVEGGLGWWRDTRFPTETPKFIMGGVAPNFSEIANGPAHGAGNWEKPRGLYGVAQLSPWVLFPIDGLNIKQGTAGQLFGYGYLPLPLLSAKTTTAGKNTPTGENCWTLFLNTGNFKGPLAFFTPYFWSHSTLANPELAGKLLDTRPTEPNRALQMETQYVPAAQATDSKGETWARIAPTRFPRQLQDQSAVVHLVTAYNKRALYDGVKAWFAGGPAATGAIDPAGAAISNFPGKGGATWKIYTDKTPKDQKASINWKSFATPTAPDPHTFGYKWNDTLVSKDDGLIMLPEYYHLVTNKNNKQEWQVVSAKEVPAETGLADFHFNPPHENPEKPYTTPDDPKSTWKKPGPVAGPFKAHLGDHSTVTYYWYRFADQPAILNADLTDEEREALQAKVVKLHQNWKKDRDYLAPPAIGSLADIDPAQLVTPPPGYEVGYVPIATKQEAGE
jgi:hypothetical protein